LSSRKEQREDARRQREEREAEERKKQRRKRRLWQVGSVLVVAIAAVVIAVVISSSGGGSSNTQPSQQEADQTTALFEGVAQSGVTLGNPDAQVTIYEFADLQCPFCRDFTKNTFPQIVDKYVRPGKVKIVFRNLTFLGPDSVTAARAAAAAGAQNKLWNFVDLFYLNQGPENSGYVTDAFITDLTSKLSGIDSAKLTADMSAPLVEQQLGTAQQQAAEFKISSTPSFLLQIGKGKLQPLGNKGNQFDEMSKLLDAALAKVKS
jgi:protein-disulfide isomerase